MRNKRGFTLMEMMVAVGMLLLVIMAVGYIFKNTSTAVGMSQASVEMFSNVRAAQYQLERDLAGLNRNGFLVIRSRKDGTRRQDQISFLASGTFANRTGGLSTAPGGVFGDQTVANAAVVWYGHGVVESMPANQGLGITAGMLPTGSADKDFVLCRHTSLLLPSPAGVPVLTDVVVNTPSAAAPEGSANIASSRICTVGVSAGQMMQKMLQYKTGLRYVADNYCYRFRVLPNPYMSEVGGTMQTVNGVFRMHPILLQGAPSFAVEWTDGGIEPTGQLRWFGLLDRATKPAGSTLVEPAPTNNDQYTAVFTCENQAIWPKALKITYRVTDANDRLKGGREFVQVVKLP